MRLSGVMEGEEVAAVAALVGGGGVGEERGRPPVALGDDERAIRQYGGQRLRQLAPEARRQAVWRVEKDEIVMTRLPGCRAEKPQRVRAPHLGRSAEGVEVGPHGGDRGRRRVDERRLGGAARERLE